MRVKLLTLILALTLLMPMVGTLPIASAQETAVFVTLTDLRVRAQPRVQAPTLQIIPQNTTALAIGRNADTSWLQVEYKGVVGWVSVFYLSSSDDLTALRVTDATDPTVDRTEEQISAPDGTIVQTGELVVFSTTSNVNVRILPDEGADRLGQLRRNERAVVNLLDPTRLWGRIEFEGQSGWVALYVVNVLGDVRTVEVLGEPATSSELPIADINDGYSLEQREIIERVQAHLARYIGYASSLMTTFSNGASSGFIACGPEVPFFRPFAPQPLDYPLVPDLEAIVSQMNTAFDQINRARAAWVSACAARQTIVQRDQFPVWLAETQAGAALLDQVQRDLAVLSTR